MPTYARDVIQNAGLLSGILDVFSSADDNELRAYLTLLNSITAQYSQQEYFPYSKDIYTTTSLLEPSKITIGKELINAAGLSDTYITGTITGLTNNVNGTGDTPVFANAHIVSNGVKLYVPVTSVLNSGRVTDEAGNYFEIVAGVPAISGTIAAGSTLTLTTANLTTNSGVYTDVDIFAEQPTTINTLSYLNSEVYTPIDMVNTDQFDSMTILTQNAGGYPVIATARKDFPITTIELYPLTDQGAYQITAGKTLGPFGFDSEVRVGAAYIAFLEQELAYRIAVMNGALEKVQLLKSMAASSLADIKRLNDKYTSILSNSATFARTSYDINTDTWR